MIRMHSIYAPLAIISPLLLYHYNKLRKDSTEAINQLDQHEQIPVQFHGGAQPVDFLATLDKANVVKERLGRSIWCFAKIRQNLLERKIIGLQYRLEKTNQGLDPLAVHDRETLTEIKTSAKKWKKEHPPFYASKLTSKEKAKLKETCLYPLLVSLLEKDKSLKDEFFEWIIVEGNSVKPFVEFPNLQKTLTTSNLSNRIGSQGSHLLKITKTDCPLRQKIVTLPFEGKDVNILDRQNSVTLENNYQVTIQEFFAIFKRKNKKAGTLEFFQDGIRNWNTHVRARWNPAAGRYDHPAFSANEPFKDYPLVKPFSKKKVEKLTGKEILNNKAWILAVRASKGCNDLDLIINHAALEVLIPHEGKYRPYDLGKLMADFPDTNVGFLKAVCDTVPAAVMYPDEINFQLKRIHAYYAREMDDTEKQRLIDVISNEFQKAGNGSLSFQMESDNCAEWVQNVWENVFGKENTPNFFRVNLFDVNAPGLLGRVILVGSKLPKRYQLSYLHFFHYPYAPSRGRWVVEGDTVVWKSMTHTDFWRTGSIYIPSMLHEQLENG